MKIYASFFDSDHRVGRGAIIISAKRERQTPSSLARRFGTVRAVRSRPFSSAVQISNFNFTTYFIFKDSLHYCKVKLLILTIVMMFLTEYAQF